MKKLTAAWVKKAEADYLRAVKLARVLRNDHDGVCYNCQQSAEKYLKALLEELALDVPRTHILRDLMELLLPDCPSLRSLQRGLKFLTRFAVGIRYPGDDATKRQSTAARRCTAGAHRSANVAEPSHETTQTEEATMNRLSE
jgi:HEPN domain-containing protein